MMDDSFLSVELISVWTVQDAFNMYLVWNVIYDDPLYYIYGMYSEILFSIMTNV